MADSNKTPANPPDPGKDVDADEARAVDRHVGDRFTKGCVEYEVTHVCDTVPGFRATVETPVWMLDQIARCARQDDEPPLISFTAEPMEK